MKGTWWEGSLVGDPEGYVEKAVETGIYFHRDLGEEPGRGFVYSRLSEMVEGGSRYGTSLSEEAHCRGPQGTLGYERKALETGISLHGGSIGQNAEGFSTGDFERWLKEALEVQRLSIWELCEGNLEGGLPCWGP